MYQMLLNHICSAIGQDNYPLQNNKNFAEGYVMPGKDHVKLSDNALYFYQVLP